MGSAARAIWDFVVGDQPTVALFVAAAIGLTAGLADAGLSAWYVMPAAVVLVLVSPFRRPRR